MPESSEVQLGQRVRAGRQRQRLSLRALATMSGLSVNAISRIERGESSPTVASLARLAEALGLPITALFESPAAPAAALVRRERRPRTEGDGVVLESLAADLPDRRLEVFMLTLRPRACTPAEPIIHAGQEFVLCLQGSVEWQVGEQAHRLGTGDSLLFLASQPHLCRNDSPGFATLILAHERDPHAPRNSNPHLES